MQGLPIIIGGYIAAAVLGVILGNLLRKKRPVLIKKRRMNDPNARNHLGGETAWYQFMKKPSGNGARGYYSFIQEYDSEKSGIALQPAAIERNQREAAIDEQLELAIQRLAQAKTESDAAAERARCSRLEAEEKARIVKEMGKKGSFRHKQPVN